MLLLWGTTASLVGQAAAGTGPLVLPLDSVDAVRLRTDWLVDTSGTLSITDVLDRRSTSSPWRNDSVPIELTNYYCWVRLSVHNQASDPTNVLVQFHRPADSIAFYRVVGDRITSVKRWTRGEWEDRPYLTFAPNVFSLGIGGEEQVTLYARLYEPYSWNSGSIASARLVMERPAVNRHIVMVAWHSVYIGLMLGIAALGVLTYRLFRERAFLWFSLLTLCFAFYFADENQITALIGFGSPVGSGYGIIQFSIAGLIISLTFFLIAYTDLRRYWPRYTNFLLGVAGIAVLAQFLFNFSDIHVATAALVANAATLTWIVVISAPVFLLARRGSNSAIRLLIGTAMLLIPGVIYVVQLIVFNRYYAWSQIGFEIGTLGFSILLFFGLYTKVEDIRQRAKTLTEQSELKSKFFANISHEFRTPLTLIMGPVEQLLKQFPESSQERKLLQVAYRNAKRQLRLVNRILELSRLEATEGAVNVQLVDLPRLLEEATDSFAHLAGQKEIALSYVGEVRQLLLTVDQQRVEEAVNNLLSNALKFTGRGGRVTVSLRLTEGEAVIAVADTGVGIPKEMLDGVFNRFYQGEASRFTEVEGSGIGLSLVRETARLHGGRVTVESEYGRGSTFSMYLPLATAVPVDVAAERPLAEAANGAVETGNTVEGETSDAGTGLPRVLIVEDNAELRSLLQMMLETSYRVTQAVNGADGIERAVKTQPDLIISDVMMPVKDGFELCRTLKSRVETSHIPIILLTARASFEARIEGLEYGADDYLTKPFSHQELMVRAKNLIDGRQLLRQRYAAAIELRPEEVTSSPVDAEFLARATAVVEEHMSDETFRVADFAREIGMSSTSLNRKLRGLLGQSTNQFMQSVRLQRAAELLRRGEYTVAEIALETGFSSSTYFVKLFKEKYGVTPGSFEKAR
ncbi:ATP-binding protein [Lewinella sp. JB7]|nr:ATP-binding protein [Lewinella sp. JB7]